MQMNPVQSGAQKITFMGKPDGSAATLTATCMPSDTTLAKNILMKLREANHYISWTIELQDDTFAFWCGLHNTFGCRMKLSDLGKGMHVVKKRGQELVERIRAGCY